MVMVGQERGTEWWWRKVRARTGLLDHWTGHRAVVVVMVDWTLTTCHCT